MDYSKVDWERTTGAELYRHAKTKIPGGTQLLSKRPERFLPKLWPSYYSRAKGCEVWDLDGRRLIDVCIHSVGNSLLGFADDDVNAAVKEAIDRGNMSSLNSPAEVELADLLCQLHPWADRVRYARAGGESMSIAVRIARAFTGRDKIAFCGYHGWSDWYLAANLSSDTALDGHLMPGLEPRGVPRGLQGTALPFRYNHLEELEELVAQHGSGLAAIVMEPMRRDWPEDNFLERIREIADSIGAVLVFDEVSAGWRFCLGGVHLKLGMDPDIAVFSKSISNGYPMAAIIGRKEAMSAAEVSFISSTTWTDAIGPTAALATLRKMKKIGLSAHIDRIGSKVQEGWRLLAKKHNLAVGVHGQHPMCSFSLDYGTQAKTLGTLLTQHMLNRGFLATESFCASFAHTDEVLDQYQEALDSTFGELAEAIEKGDVENRLQGPIAESGFSRLT